MFDKKLYEDIVGAVWGCFGGGVFLTNAPTWWDKFITGTLFVCSAFCAAFIGTLAKRCADYLLKKIIDERNNKNNPPRIG